MDRHFLEFWGNYLINVAEGQRKLEEMTEWITQGFKGFEELTAMFRRFYGLDRILEDSPDYLNTCKRAEKDFLKSFQDYLNLFGVVSLQEHLALVKKYEELKEKVATQEETINHLRMLLEEKGAGQAEVFKGFQDLVEKQGEEFRDLMKGFSGLFREGLPTEEE